MTKILITGATGNVGRELTAQLPADAIRLLSRTPVARNAEPSRRPETVVGDLGEAAGLAAALDGVDTVFLIWPFLSAEAAPVVLAELGRGRRIVYLSSSGLAEGHDDPINRMHAEVEQLVEDHAASWTILRSNTIASNARGWAAQIRSTGVVRGPDIPATAVVHERDLASVAARALTSSELSGRRLVLTGPAVVSRAEQVAALGAALGRELRFEAVSAEEARAQMLADGRPAALVEALLANVGRPPSSLVTSTIEEVTGAPARSFGLWAGEHAGEFR
ncbi:NAD(P)H-binding protein [Streptomyces sp. SID13031]|uniref:NAD(P)H-binding protein n=1 Tax=Streptomyces sp. SID13031 TaxID=2706046 RepID=UPI0013CB37BB|nr:NAD(P)H-binding protein [Streptomyces sp. SID13031]NEA34559.1 NAD(P)H-binding protein [Streptomyces sp. SID13031]